ncbi:hypothetical protein KDW_62220 [Dictyobacter vulcani]|uniref:Cache domain-containing protein n=1 Tax=Dictyobacter vulcani TaxID=2607529 RepID=A0A5J4KZT3_9CHLR|nr:cache domain-containing protein [Dictyobacter vulcani]GER92060.1 hypothetical protein KDW_62220 [Dictyobacter vulcani]
MAQRNKQAHKRTWFSLPQRISFGYVLAAVIPLLLVIAFIWTQTRPTLITQANGSMTNDAQTRVQLIDTYFRERKLDALALTQVPSVQTFLAVTPADDPFYRNDLLHATYALQAGLARNADYEYWSLFRANGDLIQSYPAGVPKHGNSYFTPDQLQMVKAGKTFVSPVFYSSDKKEATVDIYAPIDAQTLTKTRGKFLGFMRATLRLNYVWNEIVKKDANVHGPGSYAFIVDDNGIRVADTDARRLFTSIKPLQDGVQQTILDQQRYGDKSQINGPYDTDLSKHLNNTQQTDDFIARPDGGQEDFQVVRHATSEVPWQYLVLSPVNSVTDIANQQTLDILGLAFLAALLVAIAGYFAGKGITGPVMRAVDRLRGNSQSLNTLAQSQQDAAGEQIWVVDSSQVGLQSVQYYTDAAKAASEKLANTSQGLKQQWGHVSQRQAEQALDEIISSSKYLTNALEYQYSSNQKLATALKVATQVTEQLHVGATSATEAAEQLEQVVQELRSVVGR